jgi:serine phosphatase RsbU (regulator of sigma subunit)
MLNPGGTPGGSRGEDNGLEMALCRWEPDSGVLRFAAARIHLYRIGAEGVSEWEGDRTGLGYWRGDASHRFTEHTIDAREGATFLMCSDGLLDQPGGPKGLPFGRRHLRSVLEEVAGASLSDQRAAVARSLAEWQGDQPQRDDITVVGFRPRGGDGQHTGKDPA